MQEMSSDIFLIALDFNVVLYPNISKSYFTGLKYCTQLQKAVPSGVNNTECCLETSEPDRKRLSPFTELLFPHVRKAGSPELRD